ncbi:hypothetical protein Bca101_081045 [Brassica carinata]
MIFEDKVIVEFVVVDSPLVPWLLWNLWPARNKMIFEDKVYKVEDIISKAIKDAREWETANTKKKPQQIQCPLVNSKLLKAPSCYCDGAWQESTKAGGMGWIIKNEEGWIICRGSSSRSHVCSALMAEALAIRKVVKKAKDLNLQGLNIFSDCQVLVSALREGRDVNEIAGILQDIKNLATLFYPLSFSCIPRLENSQADALAKAGLARSSFVT